jgi:hypothetical protein
MPYELAFEHEVQITDPERYWNECCVGGDTVLNRLLPALRQGYEGLMTDQEDWGWFAWFEKERVKLAVDVFADDGSAGRFRMHLTSRTPRFLLGHRITDTPELEDLKALVVNVLADWDVKNLEVTRVDEKYLPLTGAI